MPGVARGHLPRSLRAWNYLQKNAVSKAAVGTVIGATTTADVLSTGIQIKIPVGCAILVRRYVVGAVSGAGVFMTIAQPAIQVLITTGGGPQAIGIAVGGSNIPPFATAGSVAGSGSWNTTFGDQVELVDDWYEWDDYRELAAMPVTLTFQGSFRVFNSSGAAASVNVGPETILYELWSKSFRLGRN